MFDIFFRPRVANFSPKFRRTGEETAEQAALQGIFLSSLLPCAVGLKLSITNGCLLSICALLLIIKLRHSMVTCCARGSTTR